MATKKLTDADVRSAKGNGHPVELWDAQMPGLCLRVSQSRKTWLVRYRLTDIDIGSDGKARRKQRRYVFGEYPTIELRDARAQAAAILRDVRGGADPAGETKRKKTEAKAQPLKTFRDLAEAYIAACEAGHWMPRGKRQSERTMKDLRESLDRYVLPELGDLRLADVTRGVVKRLQRELAGRGVRSQGNMSISAIRRIYSWAIVEFEGKLVAVNVGASQPKAPEPPRERVLTDAELKMVWQTLNSPGGLKVPAYGKQKEKNFYLSQQMAIALQLSALLLARPQEIAGMMASEVNLAQATWLVTPGRMKARKSHLVTLPPRSVELIREAIALAEIAASELQDGELKAPKDFPVFPSPVKQTQPIQPRTMTRAMHDLVMAVGLDDVILYDLRRTGSTAMTSERLGISPFIRSLVLSHTTDTGGGAAVSARHYDANLYVAEKRRALAAWEGLLLEIAGETPPAKNDAPQRTAGDPREGQAAL